MSRYEPSNFAPGTGPWDIDPIHTLAPEYDPYPVREIRETCIVCRDAEPVSEGCCAACIAEGERVTREMEGVGA